MNHRFFVNHPIKDKQVELDGSEAHHLLHVMRAEIGQQVVLLDGSGFEYQALVTQRARGTAQLEIIGRVERDRELSLTLVVGVALPKGDRQRWLVEKLVEMGVTRFQPLTTERTVSQPSSRSLVRLRRTVVEASKQCGRTMMMEICEAESLQNFLDGAPEHALRIIAHPHESPTSTTLKQRLLQQADKQPVFVAIGPEGGFTDLEWQKACHAGWQTIDLGPRILRVETAALALVAGITFSL